MRVLLAVPTGGNPAAPFLAALGALRLPGTVSAFDRLTVQGNFVPGQRELAVRRALALRADVLLMIDDDMVAPPDAVALLLEALAEDERLGCVGALYYSRDGIRPVAADRWRASDTTSAAIPAFTDGVTRCDAVGFGCVALRVAALGTLPPPFFQAQVYVEESQARVRICNEDFLLCERLRHGGWDVALHAGVRVPHYDRSTATTVPAVWECVEETVRERMLVVEAGPQYSLRPYDPTVPAGCERHQTTSVDYILVD